MSRFANIGMVPERYRAQVEKKLRSGAVVREHNHNRIEKRLAAEMPEPPKPSKYGNRRCEYDGHKFDSLKEANRWRDLRLMQHAGEIRELRRQVPFELKVNGVEVCVYIADAVYRRDGKLVTEDTKGYRKGVAYRTFKIKAALMLALHKIRVEEV